MTVMKETVAHSDWSTWLNTSKAIIVNSFLHCVITAALYEESPDAEIEEAPDSKQLAWDKLETDDEEDNMAGIVWT